MNVLYFFLGGLFAATLIIGTDLLAQRRERRIREDRDKAYDVIETLHTRLIDPAAQARLDQFLSQAKMQLEGQMAFDMAPNHDTPPEEEKLIAGINGNGYTAKDLNDLM